MRSLRPVRCPHCHCPQDGAAAFTWELLAFSSRPYPQCPVRVQMRKLVPTAIPSMVSEPEFHALSQSMRFETSGIDFGGLPSSVLYPGQVTLSHVCVYILYTCIYIYICIRTCVDIMS